MITRVDQWTEQQDQFLVNTILKYVKEGETQQKAYEYAADQLDRSKAACAYRWNTSLSKHYREELKFARRIRRGQSVEEGAR